MDDMTNNELAMQVFICFQKSGAAKVFSGVGSGYQLDTIDSAFRLLAAQLPKQPPASAPSQNSTPRCGSALNA